MVFFLQVPHQNPVYASLPPIRATCSAHLILLDFITRKILGDKYRSLSSSLCSFLHPPVTPSLLGPNILLSTLFSNTPNLRFSLSVSDQFSHPYKTTGNICNNRPIKGRKEGVLKLFRKQTYTSEQSFVQATDLSRHCSIWHNRTGYGVAGVAHLRGIFVNERKTASDLAASVSVRCHQTLCSVPPPRLIYAPKFSDALTHTKFLCSVFWRPETRCSD